MYAQIGSPLYAVLYPVRISAFQVCDPGIESVDAVPKHGQLLVQFFVTNKYGVVAPPNHVKPLAANAAVMRLQLGTRRDFLDALEQAEGLLAAASTKKRAAKAVAAEADAAREAAELEELKKKLKRKREKGREKGREQEREKRGEKGREQEREKGREKGLEALAEGTRLRVYWQSEKEWYKGAAGETGTQDNRTV